MSFALGVLLFFCVVWALLGPLVSPRIEEKIEWFMFAMGIAAATVSWSWSEAVVLEAVIRPMKVCGAVLLGSLIFSFSHDNIRRAVRRAMDRIGPRAAVGGAVIALGLVAPLITSVIAVLALVEILYAMRLEPEAEAHVAVIGSFAVGLGGGLSPIGGPVPAVAMARLAEAPYETGAYYLMGLLGSWVVPAIVTLGVVAGILFGKPGADRDKPVPEDPLSLWNILMLTGRMYVFIAGLVLLGAGLVPLIDRFLLGMSPWVLYWMNTISAVIDGATLVSVEISPRMTQDQLRYILMGLLIAGGALIPGSAHNVVAAQKLKIGSRAWARVGLPTGAILMACYFLSLVVWA
ncbi:MAG: DUF1646 family protein [Elusimicrobiota bacterium]